MNALAKTAGGEYRLSTPFSGLTIGVIAKSANTVDYTAGPGAIRGAEKELLRKATGLEARNILALDQLHGDSIIMVQDKPGEDSLIFGEADGLMTDLEGLCLVIRTADCVPVFAYDRERRVLGAAHSGWRGTRLAIAGKMVRMMKDRYGSSPGDIHAWILPSIGPESYTVGRDVADLFPRDITESNGRIHLDLWGNIERSLAGEGVHRDTIFSAGMCTLKMKDEFFSYRAGDAGRNLNFGFLT